ncbi:MAG: hypothetical protein EPN20_15785, partial [Magnetospirillum sp.]
MPSARSCGGRATGPKPPSPSSPPRKRSRPSPGRPPPDPEFNAMTEQSPEIWAGVATQYVGAWGQAAPM